MVVQLVAALLFVSVLLAALRSPKQNTVVHAVAAFFGMTVLLFIPVYLVVGAGLLVWDIVQLVQAPTLLGAVVALLHVVGIVMLAVELRHEHNALPLLDGEVLQDTDAPFGMRGRGLDEPFQVKPWRWWLPTLDPTHEVDVESGVVYRTNNGRKLRLDIYRAKGATEKQPCVVYMHGGAWILGTRKQSRFMMVSLARAGWTVVAIDYRFAPWTKLRDIVTDCKWGIAWVRSNAERLRVDAEMLVTAGGSAGGHLAALMATSGNDRALQPGFEEADTRVQGAVILYGATDIARAFETGDGHYKGLGRWMERVVVRTKYQSDPALFEQLCPYARIDANTPDVFLVHGSWDHLVPMGMSRRFSARVQERAGRRAPLLEMPHGQHGFEIMPSVLHQRAVRAIVGFLHTLRAARVVQAQSATT